MGIADKYSTRFATFDYETEGKDFTNLANLYGANKKDTVYKVKALYINDKSQYGNAPVIGTPEHLVNLPKHLLELVEKMRADEEVVSACNDDKLGFTIYTYSRGSQINYSIEWVDID